MKGNNQYTKLKYPSKEKEENVDDLIKKVLENPLPDIQEEEEDLIPEAVDQFIPRPGNQSSLSLRRKLIKLYGHADNPAVQLLIGGVVRLYSFQKKAESPDAILKLWGAIRQSILSLEQITGRKENKPESIPVSPFENMSDDDIEKEHQNFLAILGESPKQKAWREAN